MTLLLYRCCDVRSRVESGPAQYLRVDEVLFLSAHLPNAAVAAPPVLDGHFGQGADQLPHLLRYLAVQHQQRADRRDDFAEYVQLQVVGGGIANAHRSGILVATQVIEYLFLV